MTEFDLKHVKIRPVAADEVEGIADLARLVWQAAYSGIISQEQIAFMLEDRYNSERMRQELVSGKVWWDVACYGDGNQETCLGFASTQFTDEPGTLKLDKLYIHPDYQRHGLGKCLIEHIMQRAHDLSCNRLVLSVNKRNTNAINAYKTYGFTLSASVVKDIGHGFVMDDYIFEKYLDSWPA